MKEIRRLRIKFMLYNMLIVTAILGAALFAAFFLLQSRFLTQSRDLLAKAAAQEEDSRIFSPAPGVRIPYFSVLVDQDGIITQNSVAYAAFPEGDSLNELVLLGMSLNEDTGKLDDYHLRYLRVSHPLGSVIAFVDTSYEDSIGRSMGKTFVFLAAFLWLSFLVLSYFFSKWAVKPVEESIRSQKQFVADASHELKTPLTVILANAELLKERLSALPPDENRWLSNIHQESLEMRDLVENLLTLARSEIHPLEKEEKSLCSLSDLALESVLTMEPSFYQKGKSLKSQIKDQLFILGDPVQLGRLLRILLDNALKYSSPGSASELLLESSPGNRITLWVNSPGQEIPREKRKDIFKRFCRGDGAREKNGGYGLGLAIAKGIAESHKAKIGVEYRDGKNCFFVRFPAKRGNSRKSPRTPCQ